jgi:hypothetical protein
MGVIDKELPTYELPAYELPTPLLKTLVLLLYLSPEAKIILTISFSDLNEFII